MVFWYHQEIKILGNSIASRIFNFACPKSSHRQEGLAPWSQLFTTWGGSMFQRLGYSPIKAICELGSKCHEIV